MYKYVYFCLLIILGFTMTYLSISSGKKQSKSILLYLSELEIKYLYGDGLIKDDEIKGNIRGLLFIIQFILGIIMFFYYFYKMYKYYNRDI